MKINTKHVLVPYIYTIGRVEASSWKQKIMGFALEYLISSALPFFLAHIVYSSLINSFAVSSIANDILLFALGYLMLFPIHEIGFAINDIYSVRIEKPEYKTIRISDKLSAGKVALVILPRLLLFGILVKVFAVDIQRVLGVAGLIFIVFMIHNFIKVETRMVTTFPMLRFLRNTFIFLQIIQSQFEWVVFILFLFAYTITNAVLYVKRKVRKEFIFNEFVQDYQSSANSKQISDRIIKYNASIPFSFAILTTTFLFVTEYKDLTSVLLFIVSVASYYILIAVLSLLFVYRSARGHT